MLHLFISQHLQYSMHLSINTLYRQIGFPMPSIVVSLPYHDVAALVNTLGKRLSTALYKALSKGICLSCLEL